MPNQTKGIGCFMLVMLIVGAIDNIRNLPATALFGSQLIFFFIFSAIVFLVPVALVSAELSSAWSKKSGIYQWSKLAFGDKFAFLTIWFQWINTMLWFPTILSFIAGTITYLINPALAQNKLYLVSVILILFWSLTLINLKGIQTSAKFATISAIFGMLIPIFLIAALSVVWLLLNKPMQIHLTLHSMLPTFGNTQDWAALTAIMTAFLGMELSAVHVNDIKNPQKTFPKAMFYSVILILVTMIMGSLAIAFVTPKDQINLVAGTAQAFDLFFAAYHLSAIMPLIILMMLFGSVGSMINWIISPAKGLLQAAEDGYFPKAFCQKNKYGVASKVLLTQAILVSLLCLAFLLMPSVNGSYWLLTDLSTEIYMIMYVLLFLVALRLRYRYPEQERPFSVPGGKFGLWLNCLLGLFGCVITLIVGFFPPTGVNVGGAMHYIIIFSAGLFFMTAPAFVFYLYRGVKNIIPSQLRRVVN
jgi:amino acid transporter